jgi:hypothetical protein
MISAGEIEVFPGCIHHLLVADKDLLAACVQYSSFAATRFGPRKAASAVDRVLLLVSGSDHSQPTDAYADQ